MGHCTGDNNWPFTPPIMLCQGTQLVDTELALRVENGKVKAEELLLTRAKLLLHDLSDAKDVAQEDRLLGYGQAGVLVEPSRRQISGSRNTSRCKSRRRSRSRSRNTSRSINHLRFP